MQKLAWIAFAGALGALTRYSMTGLARQIGGSQFPWGTLVVNILGCFAFGIIWSLAEDHLLISAETKLIVLTGFMGAFTTFSSFIFETGDLLRDSLWGMAVVNLLLQNLVGLIFLFLGLRAGNLFFSHG